MNVRKIAQRCRFTSRRSLSSPIFLPTCIVDQVVQKDLTVGFFSTTSGYSFRISFRIVSCHTPKRRTKRISIPTKYALLLSPKRWNFITIGTKGRLNAQMILIIFMLQLPSYGSALGGFGFRTVMDEKVYSPCASANGITSLVGLMLAETVVP